MADMYLSIQDESAGILREGGPHTSGEVRVNGTPVATWNGSAWYINDGAAFGDSGLTGTTHSIILGQAK